ncbi:MAG TPA: phosphatidate cytidylyltransferase [Flavobacteriales bacterium]
MSELTKRALTGAVYVALTLGAAFIGQRTTLLLFLPVCAMGALELHRLYWPQGRGPAKGWSVIGAVLLYVVIGTTAFVPELGLIHVAGAATMWVLLVITSTLLRNTEGPAAELAGRLLGLVYVALPFALVPHLLTFGPEVFVGFMLLLWTTDTGAYLVGRTIGRTLLMPRVSPKKTVEGLAGGVVLALVVACVLHHYWPVLSLVQWLVCAVVVAITSTIGDLIESAFKRAAGVKDSGNVLPGHGGILDRFDGFLLAAPAMLLAVLLLA